ncbi:hypothetical protein DMA15_15525 [Streptomyces sp. WAC 01529]|uniref:hypothetical protein n=1 Tax=Streptomyces sp. WAC 01529 TaxID=2203205 RepID=UPI000F6F46B5|nr:hypothetical protein [Streptomyces sp. WAC 01529]AZM53815.1 hypothetical protein DMA15_15525 [Streptomyces sp. WAC 01529]
MTTPQFSRSVSEWLACAQQAPQHAHREWTERGIALLPLGQRFNTVHLPAPLVHAAVGSTDIDQVHATLAELLCGPVIHNTPHHAYYPLVELCLPTRWPYADEIHMLGAGQYLSVPASDLTGPYGVYWAVRPRIPGTLCPVPAVARLVHIARTSASRVPHHSG